MSEVRPLEDLSTSGLLWLINRTVFHPRGYALAVHYDDGKATGWELLGDGSEPWSYDLGENGENERFQTAESTLKDASRMNPTHENREVP